VAKANGNLLKRIAIYRREKEKEFQNYIDLQRRIVLILKISKPIKAQHTNTSASTSLQVHH